MEIDPLVGSPPSGHILLKGTPNVQFAGKLVANSSSDSGYQPGKDKWTELELYRKTDGSDKYVLHVIARSVLYHKENGCNNGVPVKLADLARRYLDIKCTEPIPEPCPVCKPFDIEARLRDSDVIVNAETDWHTIHVCDTVPDLLANLKQTKGPNAGKLGMPALMLLDRARRVDSRIAAELDQVRSI